jgi:hypothetical protein
MHAFWILARFDRLQPYAMHIGPLVERPAAQPGAVVGLKSPIGRPRVVRSRLKTLVTPRRKRYV